MAAEKKAKKAAPKAKAAVVEAAAEDRGTRKVREGMVVSAKMQKTVVVSIERRIAHPLYGKVVKRSERFKAHDELSCDVGDRVQIMETRPISKDKRWRVSKILEKVK
ncbi:MAG: 30S ribosomal protein S17 [Armatimonadetes bacterium]|nr:30S ribosomal protein S17 [Armatimonadota bacterium]